MSMNTLKDLYIDQLQDMYSADQQSLAVTKKLHEAATNKELKDALQAGIKGIQQGSEKIKTLIEKHGANPTGEHCKGMEGLVKEAKAHTLDETFGDDDVRDASIITQYQRMTHYAIAGYGCVLAFAKRLKLGDDAKVLSECLDNTYEGDRHMSDIAEGDINKAAA